MAGVEFTVPAGPIRGKYNFFAFDESYTLYLAVGPFGTAKTDALVTSALKTMLDYPGCVIAICRADLQVLRRTTMMDFLRKCEELNMALGEDAVLHNKKDSIVTLEVNGKISTCYFFGLVSGDYERKLKSLQPFRIYLDEASELQERMVDMALVRCRAKVYHRETGELGKVHVKMATNDMGNNWLWRRFVGKPHPGKLMTPSWAEEHVGIQTIRIPNPVHAVRGSLVEYQNPAGETTRSRIYRKVRVSPGKDGGEGKLVFVLEDNARVAAKDTKLILETAAVYSFTEENWSLNQQNIENFYLVSDQLREQYLEGKVDTLTGLMFPEFQRRTHVLGQQEIPEKWHHIVAIDHGTDHPTAAVFAALNPNGDLVVYDEYQATDLSASENAYNILAKLPPGRASVQFVGDSPMWRRDPIHPSKTIAKVYIAAGVKPLRRADDRREYGMDTVHDLLRLRTYYGFANPVPRLWIMDNCRLLIRRLEEHTHEESRLKKNDDLVDALRYVCTAVFKPEKRQEEERDERQEVRASWGKRVSSPVAGF